MTLSDNELRLEAQNDKNLLMFFQDCYQVLVSRWWNVSTAKQINDPKAVFYNRSTGDFELRPKRSPTPVPALFVKPKSWRLPDSDSAVDYQDLPKDTQKRLDDFLKDNSVELWSTSRKLLYKAPVCHKELQFLPPEKAKKSICSICGSLSSSCVEVSQPTYLLFASNSATKSFNSEARQPDKVCWQCEMLGRFAIETVSYHQRSDDLFILQINSPHLTKALNVNHKIGYGSLLREIKWDDFRSNIRYDGSLIKFARLPYEFLWAFFVQAYDIVKENSNIEMNIDTCAFLEELMQITLDQAPVEITLFMINGKGQTFITKELIHYNEPSYAFRLLFQIEEMGISAKSLFNQLWVKDEKDHYSLFRNEFFYKVLSRKSIVKELEVFAFHQTMGDHRIYLGDLLQFVMHYEVWIRGIEMTEQQIEVAVNLGKSTVLQAREKIEKFEEFKKIKGDLFALRKTRTKEAFLNQLVTFQMRYGLIVSNALQEGVLDGVSFEEFKAYCMLGALNTYNGITRAKKGEGKKDD
ncbi:MAG: hypothetical protein ACOX6I_02960 [Syntrophomonadaceae bacterium]|jgi:hypothetical protein